MNSDLQQRCAALVAELGLGTESDVLDVRQLTGGVASDIALVELPNQKICVKFALPKLKVAADWHAPVHRNAAEYAWLRLAAKVAPKCAVRLFGRSESQHGFAMEFIDGPDVYLWKTALLEEASDRDEAVQVAQLLGRIHSASTRPDFDAAPFQNRDDFHALRIEPYLVYLGQAYPDLRVEIKALTDLLYDSAQVLVHGDVSPKNILFRKGGPVLLDAECATMGDACFDPSFCLNHLILKAVHLPGARTRLLEDVGRFWGAYADNISWEVPKQVDARISRLLPFLMLARVDGKSPVEYLNDGSAEIVRRVSLRLIRNPASDLRDLVMRVAVDLKEMDA